KDQFHLVHQVGRMQSRMRCTDCHTSGVPAQDATDNTPRNECAKCHGLSFGDGGAVRLQANCNSCHQQHGQSTDTAALLTAAAADNNTIKKYVAALNTGEPAGSGPGRAPTPAGGARAIRQDSGSTGRDSLGVDALSNVGGVPWYGWVALVAIVPLAGRFVIEAGFFRTQDRLDAPGVTGA